MGHDGSAARHYEVVARAIRYIRQHSYQQPTLEDIAQAVYLSPFHLQRVFSEWAGISPKRFLQYVSKEHAKTRLLTSESVLSVALDVGLSSTSRLHDLMVTCEAMTPGDIQGGGRGLDIGFGWGSSPFGEVLVGWTPRGICHFTFCDQDPQLMEAVLAANWPHASLARDDAQAQGLLDTVFPTEPKPGKVHLVLKGTNFQIKVWEALVHTEFGKVISYQQLAENSGHPNAQRAVGSALAANDIGYLIPCHRVIKGNGEIGYYRWGSERKLAMQVWESGSGHKDGE